tara:strand:- start:288 stop:734 length:447 start_codon:yes stop_codon:yes gene_type:complete
MANLLSDTDKAYFTGVLGDLFDTFQRSITVHKEPVKTVTNINTSNTYAGYGDTPNLDNIEFVTKSESFEAMISYMDKNQSGLDTELNIQIPQNAAVRIKVKQDCRDYIKLGKTERIEIDGKSFNVLGEESVKYNFGYYLYVFYLELTK